MERTNGLFVSFYSKIRWCIYHLSLTLSLTMMSLIVVQLALCHGAERPPGQAFASKQFECTIGSDAKVKYGVFFDMDSMARASSQPDAEDLKNIQIKAYVIEKESRGEGLEPVEMLRTSARVVMRTSPSLSFETTFILIPGQLQGKLSVDFGSIKFLRETNKAAGKLKIAEESVDVSCQGAPPIK